MSKNNDRLRFDEHLVKQGMCAKGPLRINRDELYDFVQENYTPKKDEREIKHIEEGRLLIVADECLREGWDLEKFVTLKIALWEKRDNELSESTN